MSGRTRSTARERSRAGAARVAGALVAVQAALVWTGVAAPSLREHGSNALSASIAAIAAFVTISAVRPGTPTARAWRYITYGIGAWSAGAATWFVRSLAASGRPTDTGLEDLGYVLFALLLVLAFADGARRQGAAARSFLDGVVIVSALAVALWPFATDHLLQDYDAANLLPAVLLVALDVMAAVVLATLLAPRFPPVTRIVLPWVGAAVALFTVADTLYVTELGHYQGGAAIDPLWTAGFVALAIGALQARQLQGHRTPDWSFSLEPLWADLAFLPVALASTGVVAWQSATERTISVSQAAVAVVGASALLTRQVWGTAEQHRLRRGLEEEVRRRSESAARAAEDYRMLFEDVPVPAFAIARDDLAVVRLNRAATATYGLEPGRPFTDVVDPAHLDSVVAAVRSGHLDGVIDLLGTGDRAIEAGTSSRPAIVEGRECLLVLAADRTLELQALRRVERLARTDDLTGLGNRLALQEAMAASTGAGATGHLAVLVIDLDRFKSINDSLGHAAGDTVLSVLGERIQQVPALCTARLGGDEFVVVARVDDPASAVAVARHLVEVVLAPIDVGRRSLVVTASIGVASEVAGRADPAALLRDADLATYSAKAHGRNRIEVFDPGSRVPAIRRLRIEQSLRRELATSLEVWYQPVVQLATGRVIGLEALVRWRSDSVGDIPASELVTVAEDVGLINDIDRDVLARALADLVTLRAAGHDLDLATNVSNRRFEEPGLADEITRALAEAGVDPGLLCIELTETALASDLTRADIELQALRSTGVRVAIDDFGVGYASMSLLRGLPVDVVKLDRSFVADVSQDRGAAFVASMLDLATALGMHVVAEGIESAEDAIALAGVGCHRGQGFLWAPPMPLPSLLRWLDGRSAHPASGVLSSAGPAGRFGQL